MDQEKSTVQPTITVSSRSVLSFTMPQKFERKNLYYAAISANLLYISMGSSVAWTSAAIPLLRDQRLEPGQETLMVSLLMLGSCFGPTIYSSSIDRFGRKYSLLMTGVIYLLSWLILGLSSNIYSLYVGRFIGGLAVGSTLNCVPVYVSEISDVEMRQTLTSLTEVFISLGCLIEYAAGPWLTYGNLIMVSVLPTLIFGLAASRIPESPYHLVSKGKNQLAFQTLVLLRGPDQNVYDELIDIERSVKDSERDTGSRMDLFRQRGPRKALLLSSLMFFILPFAAVDVVASYLGPIFESTSLPFSHKIATIIVGVIEVLFGALEPPVVHKFGSKWTLIVCSFFCSVFLLMFGVYKYFDERHYDLSSVSYVPVVALVLYEVFFVLGIGTISWSISVELFPPSLKGFGMNVVTTMNWTVDFLVVTLYGDLWPVVGVSSCFIGFAVILAVGTTLMAVFVPNTKGVPMHTIQTGLQR